MTLGFIGLGDLGTPVATNLLERNGQLYVYNRTPEKMKALVEKGASACNSVKELAAVCDIVFSLVSDDDALRAVTLGEDGIAANMKPGSIHVSVSTVSPGTAEKLAGIHESHSQHYIAAPVMGRPSAAVERKLNSLVSGDPVIIEKIRPYLLQAGAVAVWDFGEKVSAANVAKLCNNFLIVSMIESLSEAMLLAEKSGLDKHKWISMITGTLFNAPVYHTYSDLIANETYLPAKFKLRLGLKDINLALDQAGSVNANMPVGEQLKEQMDICVSRGYADYDWAAIGLALR